MAFLGRTDLGEQPVDISLGAVERGLQLVCLLPE
jgi:hypothetical protein